MPVREWARPGAPESFRAFTRTVRLRERMRVTLPLVALREQPCALGKGQCQGTREAPGALLQAAYEGASET
eukprot:1795336-Pleurochrysis_carterae.AAC.1